MLAQPTNALFYSKSLVRNIPPEIKKILYLHPRTTYRKVIARTNSNGTCSPRHTSAIKIICRHLPFYSPTIRKSFALTTFSKSTVTNVLIIPTRLSFFSSFFSSLAAAADLVVEESAFALPFVELDVVSD